MPTIARRIYYELLPAGLFLFILPFTHTVALRLFCLLIAVIVGLYLAFHGARLHPPGTGALILWASIGLLSIAWSVRPHYSLGELRNEVGYTILTYFVFFYSTGNEAVQRFWRCVIVTSCSVISLYAIFTYVQHNDWLAVGWLGDRNAYSTYVVLIMPFLLLTVAQTGIGFTPNRLFWIVIPLVCVAGYLTLNRMMWPALILEAIIFYGLRLPGHFIKRKTKLVILSVLVVLCSLATITFIAVSYTKTGASTLSTTGLENSITHDPRPEIWSYSVQRIAQRPWTGYGFGRGILRHDFVQHFNNPYYWHAHNMVLNYALEAGPWGVIALLFLFATFWREYWKLYKNADPKVRMYGRFGLALLAGAAVKSMTDDIIIRENSLLFWSLIGMSLGYAGHKLAGINGSPSSPSACNGER